MSSRPKKCSRCADRPNSKFAVDFEMAFQPIVSASTGKIFAHEALVRGPNGEGAGVILDAVTQDNRYNFDQTCRTKAIETAAALNIAERLSINFMPNAVYEPRNCIQATLWAADKHNLPLDKLIFEVTEGENILELDHLKNIFAEYRKQGFTTAIDDFGAGYSGLNLLADLQPDLIKIDMGLVRGIDQSTPRQEIIKAIVTMSRNLGIEIIAEGIETFAERSALQSLGVDLMQGYFFARPAFKALVQESDMVDRAFAA